MGKPDTPQYPQITAPSLMTGANAYGGAQDFFSQNYPSLLNAQSTALSQANDPNFYASFQPTSFENALGQQGFQNIWPNELAAMQHQQSLSGQSYTPGASQSIGNAYGNLAFQVGQYLNSQANTRAQGAISAGMGINPMSMLTPYADLGAQQSNQQGQFDFNAQIHNADASYSNQMANYNQKMSQNQGIGQLVGGGLGFAVGGPGGAAIGSGLGGSLFGSQNSMANSLMSSQYMGGMGQPFNGMFQNGANGAGMADAGKNFASAVSGAVGTGV